MPTLTGDFDADVLAMVKGHGADLVAMGARYPMLMEQIFRCEIAFLLGLLPAGIDAVAYVESVRADLARRKGTT